MSDTGEMRDVPPDAAMPPGDMREPDVLTEQEEMPAGSMASGEEES